MGLKQDQSEEIVDGLGCVPSSFPSHFSSAAGSVTLRRPDTESQQFPTTWHAFRERRHL